MAVLPLVLDTDILSAIMRRHLIVIPKARTYLEEHGQFYLSIITRYEILRGLKAKNAIQQAAYFENFCLKNSILPLTEEAISKAAEIYADLSQQGQLIGDADLLIAASALVRGFGVVTNNENHFRRIRDLHIENWMK